MRETIIDRLGITPLENTGGGTSDARHIHHHCPVAELGLVNTMAHKVDEYALVDDVRALARIYAAVLSQYFRKFA